MVDNRSKQPWYGEEVKFFGSYYLKIYANSITPERTQEEVAFIQKLLPLKDYPKILDLACGHGRHAIELAKTGYNMTGQDINSFFLEKAKREAKKAGVQVQWIKSDMRHIPFEGVFNAVINLFTSFGYLENDQEDQKVVYEVAKGLRPGGRFVLGITNKKWLEENLQPKEQTKLPDGSLDIHEQTFNLLTGYSHHHRLSIKKDGSQEKKYSRIRRYTLEEVTEMCKQAGLQLKETYGSYKGEPFKENSRYCIIVTEKPILIS